MISVDSDTAAVIRSGSPQPVALLTLYMTPIERMASTPYELTIGGQTFAAGDKLIGTLSAQRQRTITQDTFTIIFAGIDYEAKFVSAGYLGVKMELQTAFLKPDGTWTSPVHAQTGFSSDMVVQLDDDEGLVTVVEFRDVLSIAAGEHVRYATDENQRRIDKTDDAMLYAHRADRFMWGEQIKKRRNG